MQIVWFPSTVTVPLISSIVSLQWMFLSCRSRLAAIRTPPCGSCSLSFRWISKPRSFGSTSLEAMLLSNQVSDPMIMSGSESINNRLWEFSFLPQALEIDNQDRQ